MSALCENVVAAVIAAIEVERYRLAERGVSRTYFVEIHEDRVSSEHYAICIHADATVNVDLVPKFAGRDHEARAVLSGRNHSIAKCERRTTRICVYSVSPSLRWRNALRSDEVNQRENNECARQQNECQCAI